jgi:DNA-binding Lrp family transcriptional regulator
MAAELGIAPSTCMERIRGLRDRGVIRGYRAEVDLQAIDRSTQAIISIKLRPQAMAVATAFQDYVMQLPQTLDMFMVSGASDFLAHVAVKDTQALRDLVLALAKRQEIADIRSSVVFEHHRRTTIMPLDSGDGANRSSGGASRAGGGVSRSGGGVSRSGGGAGSSTR